MPSVNSGDVVGVDDYKAISGQVINLLGNGQGNVGYGQICSCADPWNNLQGTSDVVDPNTADEIGQDEWNRVRADINKMSRHQQDNDTVPEGPQEDGIIGAEASGTSVTRISGDSFSIDSPQTGRGINDIDSGLNTVESNYSLVSSEHYSLTDTRAFINSTRTATWGGDGQNQVIYAEQRITFLGGYNVTTAVYDDFGNITGVSTTQASGWDHRRHFFNAGGEVRLSAALTGATAKESDWGTILGNSGFVIFGANETTKTGTGRAADGSTDVNQNGVIDIARGNFQLTTGYQTIFEKNGSQAEYAENYFRIQAKRSADQTEIIFRFEFGDLDTGDQTGIGPDVDEPVGGTLECGIDLLRPSGSFVSVPEPSPDVITELRLT